MEILRWVVNVELLGDRGRSSRKSAPLCRPRRMPGDVQAVLL